MAPLLRALPPAHPAPAKGAGRRAGEKIASAMAGKAPQVPLHVSGWNRMSRDGADAEQLLRYIRDDAEIEIAYLDLEERQSRRAIQPLALIY